MYHADDFFERHKHWSEFHQLFCSNQILITHYHQSDFLIYRLVLGVIYSILPELGVSNLRKEKITNIVSKLVEDYYGINWRTVLEEFNNGKFSNSKI